MRWDWGAGLRELKPFAGMEIQSLGGTSGAIAEGVRRLGEMAEAVRFLKRAEEPVSRMVLGHCELPLGASAP